MRRRIAPIGLSIVINAVLLGLLARTFSASTVPAETYLVVELQRGPVRVQAVQPAKDEVKPVPPSRPKPQPPLPPPERSVQKPPAKAGPATAVLSSKQELRPRDKPREIRAEISSPSPPPALPTPAIGPGEGDLSSSSASGAGTMGGTDATGPGVFAGPGEGGAASHGGIGTGDSSRPGQGSKEGRGVGPSDDRRSGPPAAQAPKPAPKGETRGPRIINQPRPSYPRDARDEGIEGTVVLVAAIDARGFVSRIRMERSSGDRRLDRAAEQAIKRWTYDPCLKDGVPVGSSVRVRVKFQLE